MATKKSAGVALEVNLREHETYLPLPSTNKASYSGFETQRRCHQKSRTGITEKDLCPLKVGGVVRSSYYTDNHPMLFKLPLEFTNLTQQYTQADESVI